MLTGHTDLQVLPDKQIRGALRHIRCDWTYTSMETPRAAYKAISLANAKRMIDTSQEHRRDRFKAVQAGQLSVYMEDVVRRLERLQRGEKKKRSKAKSITRRSKTSGTPST